MRADYWLRFAIDNTAARDQELLLELDSLYEAVELRVFIAARRRLYLAYIGWLLAMAAARLTMDAPLGN